VIISNAFEDYLFSSLLIGSGPVQLYFFEPTAGGSTQSFWQEKTRWATQVL
jgi:hypothetical protein